MPLSGRWSNSVWLALRRPLTVACCLGCAVSLMATGALTLRLALPAAVYWSFVPLVELAGLAVAVRGQLRAEVIDDFFAAHGPWLLWVAAFTALWTFVPAPAVIGQTGFPRFWYVAGALIAIWTAWLDLAFFRRKGQRFPAAAMVVQRAVSWPLGMLIFVAPAGWQTIAARFGL